MNIKNILLILLISANLFSSESGLKQFIKNHKAATTGSLLLASFALYWTYQKYSSKPTGKKPGHSQEKEIKKDAEQIQKEQDLFTKQINILNGINYTIKEFDTEMEHIANIKLQDGSTSLLKFLNENAFKEPSITTYPVQNIKEQNNDITNTKNIQLNSSIQNVLNSIWDNEPTKHYDGITQLLHEKAQEDTIFFIDKDATIVNEKSSPSPLKDKNAYMTSKIINQDNDKEEIFCLKENFIYLLEKDLSAATQYADQKSSPVVILTRDNQCTEKTASLLKEAKFALNTLGLSNEKIPLGETYSSIKENKVFTSESFFYNGLACSHQTNEVKYAKPYALFNIMKEYINKNKKSFYPNLIFIDDSKNELIKMALFIEFLKNNGLDISAHYYLFKDNRNEKSKTPDKSKKFIYTPLIALPSSAQSHQEHSTFLTGESSIKNDEEGKKYAEDETGTWKEYVNDTFYEQNRKP